MSTDFHAGSSQGFAIIADGMGGHAAGDVASNLAAVQSAGHLKVAMQEIAGREDRLPGEMRIAIDKANATIAERVGQDSRVAGMGTTLLAVAIVGDHLYWGSVGDSPLYLVRDAALRQLNQDHSMAPVIAAMVERGEITSTQAKQHPDRNALTSVLMGEKIEKSDVPDAPMALQPGDVLIAASDGLQFLDEAKILDCVVKARPGSSTTICNALMQSLKDLEDPHQDNSAIVVIQRHEAEQTSKPEVKERLMEDGGDNDRPQTRILSADDEVETGNADQSALKGQPPLVASTATGREGNAHSAGEGGAIGTNERAGQGASKSGYWSVALLVALAAGLAAVWFLRQ
ncbi:protein phosphatase 2C domain-containing protein [Ahrensia marina]|uniref:PP2C family protein-serine/threonine phosphatase n=1 Tax=Ahrensia marina TaxID=1514904 RepID=UPI0035D0799B